MTTDCVLEALESSGVKRASANEPMTRHTSWRIGGPADYFCTVENEDQLLAATSIAREHGLPWLVLGGGNNILVSDSGIAGLVILNRLRGLQIERPNDGPVLACGAGVFFAKAAQYSAKRGFTGMEWGIAIPGTVGAGVVNNAGAHWSDVDRTLISADVLDPVGNRRRLLPAHLTYQYRQSSLKRPHTAHTELVVTTCRFRVAPDDAQAATARVEELRLHRLRTQPVKEASAGSTFKNPPGGFAGELIDRAGLKGHRIGAAQIAPLHANFILNRGAARASDVVSLILLAQGTVRREFDVILEPEVQFVGRWDEDVLRSVLGDAA